MTLAQTAGLLAAAVAFSGPITCAGAAELANVPFRYVHHEIVVSVAVNGRAPCDMLLDTDTSPSVVATSELARLGLSTHGASGYGSGVGSERHRVFAVTVPALRFGALTVRRLDALTTDLRPIDAALHTRLCGVLGYSFFRDRVVQVDYPHRIARVLDDAVLQPFTAPFTLTSGDEIVVRDAHASGRRVAATIDTGDGAFGNVTAQGIRSLGAEGAARKGKRGRVSGYNGSEAVTSGMLPAVRLGKRAFPSFPVVYDPGNRAPYDLNLGNRLFERYVVTFDYQRWLLTIAASAPGPLKQ